MATFNQAAIVGASQAVASDGTDKGRSSSKTVTDTIVGEHVINLHLEAKCSKDLECVRTREG